MTKQKHIVGATNVKNAFLLYDEETDTFDLWHYETIIMRIVKNKVIFALKCSNSSTKAIEQTCDYFGLDFYNDIKPKMIKYDKFKRYDQGEVKRYSQRDIKGMFA
jgi:hypothetical protein